MKLHPREDLVREAEKILQTAIVRVIESDLTLAEYVSVLSRVCSEAIQQATKYVIREEAERDAAQATVQAQAHRIAAYERGMTKDVYDVVHEEEK